MTRYDVYVTPLALASMRGLPGHMRQRVRREVQVLVVTPRPSHSRQLDFPASEWELRRLRLDQWRVIYAIIEEDRQIAVLAVRKRPPYDYGDLGQLIEGIE